MITLGDAGNRRQAVTTSYVVRHVAATLLSSVATMTQSPTRESPGQPPGQPPRQRGRGRGRPRRSPEERRRDPSVAVIGGGAIGGIVAAAVRDAGHPVTQDTAGASGWLSRMTDRDTTVVVLQNGVDHTERVAPLVPTGATVLPALVYVAAERTHRGHVLHRGGGRLVLPDTPAAGAFRTLLATSDLEVTLEPDFVTARWRKLLSNLAANPITALTLRRLDVLSDESGSALARDVLAEGVAVATAEGAHLAPDEVDRTMSFYAGLAPTGGTSMLYDRLAGRHLEHELITGAVVGAADRHGIPVPVNRTLLALLKAVNTRTAP
jgi:2-dehydropantoate 2-reductase